MSTAEYKKYCRILEVDERITMPELRRVYQQLKRLYEGDSLATIPLAEELDADSRQRIMAQIEEAFQRLSFMLKEREKTAAAANAPAASDGAAARQLASGALFRELRRRLGATLQEISFFTRIQRQALQDIEEENFSALPAEAYLRHHLMTYARFLGLEPEKAAAHYLHRLRQGKK